MEPVVQQLAAALVALAVLAGSIYEFSMHYIKGRRSRNPAYLVAALGLAAILMSLLGASAMRPVLAWLLTPRARLALFVLGCAFLLGSLALFLYLTYYRPHRLRFEDNLIRSLPPAAPPRRP